MQPAIRNAPSRGFTIGADADIAIWDPNETRIVGDMHDMDIILLKMKITGWPRRY